MNDSARAAKTREVAPGVVEVFLPLPSKPSIINTWLLDCGDGAWALIDTGVALDASREAFRAALDERGIEPQQIRHLLGTHHHPDHFGASRLYQDMTGARVHLHPLELERIEISLAAGAEEMLRHSRRHGMPIPPNAEQFAPRPRDVWAGSFEPTRRIDHPLADGEVLELGRRRLRVVWTPGHTPGHCCLLEIDSGVLFVGDHLLPKITPHVGVYPTSPPNPLGDFLASQEKVAALEKVSLVCPAHGPTFTDHRHRAHQLIAHHEYRLRAMVDALRLGPATAFEVARKAFAWVFEDPVQNRFQIGAALMETLAHLDLLHARGTALREDRSGVLHYALP
jgi:glyoxylase-like metal-dependent hydrolase (beta-lactamase superfamily II)